MFVSRSTRHLAATGLALTLAFGTAAPLMAQEATPESGMLTFPITPDPDQCQGEARTVGEVLALWYTPEGSPVPAATPITGATSVSVPIGPPADEATTAAVTTLVSEIFSCFAAGDRDILRATALFTDDLTRGFGGGLGTTMEQARGFLEAPPSPEMMGEASQIVSVSDVMELDDGRLGAIVVESIAGQPDAVYAIFENQGDRWLVDEIIEFGPAGGGEESDGA